MTTDDDEWQEYKDEEWSLARQSRWQAWKEKNYDPKVAFNYGAEYHYGDIVPKDDKEAFYWLTLSAIGKYPLAYAWISSMYYDGDGVKVNYAKALMWGLKAQNNGKSYEYLNERVDKARWKEPDVVIQKKKEKKMNSKEINIEIKAVETEIKELNEQKEYAVAKVKRLKKLLPKVKEKEKKAKRKALEQEQSDAVKKIKEIEAVLNK